VVRDRASHDAFMTLYSGAGRRSGPLAVAVIASAIGLCVACSSPDPGSSTSPAVNPSATSPLQASAACAELRADGRQFQETLRQYQAGQSSRIQVLAAAENLLHSAQEALAAASTALRTQVERVRSAAQALITTLRASPPVSADQVRSAANRVLDALNGLERLCASPGATPTP
jgi:hypothetical protein